MVNFSLDITSVPVSVTWTPGCLGFQTHATTPSELLTCKCLRVVCVFLDHSPLLNKSLVTIFSQKFGLGRPEKFF